jgi:hypothetical protein
MQLLPTPRVSEC